MISDYHQFLERKAIVDAPTGIPNPRGISKSLYPFQGACAKWMLQRGRAALFAGTGTGKTAVQSECAKHAEAETKLPALILAPLAVAHQTIGEAKKILGMDIVYAEHPYDIGARGMYITNYQKLDRFDDVKFGCVVLDECFAPGTMIDCFNNGIVLKKDIRYIRENETIYNASGIDTVSNCHRRKIHRAVKVTFNGQTITCSENHPWFTQRGWCSARDLRKADSLLETTEAVRLVQGGIYSKVASSSEEQILREVLLSEMADEQTGFCGKNSHGRNARKDRKEKIGVASFASWIEGNGKDQNAQSYVSARSASESEPYIESHEPSTFRAWGKRQGTNEATIATLGGSVEWMGERVFRFVGKTESRLSESLQTRHCEPGIEDQYRSGRSNASFEEGSRQEAGCHAGFVGVESVEILEQGNPELEQFRDSDGNIYFYDIGLIRHPSFSINGVLVHNSSIIKSQDGKTKAKLLDRFADTPFRFACTATPAPNDYMELGNHAEFLGVMKATEMLSTFFVHDGGETQKWRLKGHAEKDFWRWMASWAICFTHPRDLGFEQEGYDLPELRIHEVIVDFEGVALPGELFAMPAKTLDQRRGARRESIDERVAKCAEIIATDPEAQWATWCGLNTEAEQCAKITDSENITGSDSDERKETMMLGFANGEVKRITTKTSIAGFGMNWQLCHNTIFVGLNDSFEALYQAIRRFWRFGQLNPVDVYIILSSLEGEVLKNIKRKEADAVAMQKALVEHMAELTKKQLTGQKRNSLSYIPKIDMQLPDFIFNP